VRKISRGVRSQKKKRKKKKEKKKENYYLLQNSLQTKLSHHDDMLITTTLQLLIDPVIPVKKIETRRNSFFDLEKEGLCLATATTVAEEETEATTEDGMTIGEAATTTAVVKSR
jgi:hypothetical protein